MIHCLTNLGLIRLFRWNSSEDLTTVETDAELVLAEVRTCECLNYS